MSQRARIAAGVLLLGGGLLVSEAIRGMADLSRNPGIRVGFEMLGIEVGLALLAVGVALALPGPVGERLGLRRGRLPWSGVAALIAGALGLSAAIDGVFSITRAAEDSNMAGISRALGSTPWGALAFAAFATALAPGVCEELLCRGLVQRSLARWAGPVGAVVGGALVFGWLHGEWIHGGIAATIGLYLGTAARWADSTRPAMAAHTANNLLALLGSMGVLRLAVPAGAAIGGGLVLAAGGLAWAWRSTGRGPDEPPEPRPPGELQLASGSADP